MPRIRLVVRNVNYAAIEMDVGRVPARGETIQLEPNEFQVGAVTHTPTSPVAAADIECWLLSASASLPRNAFFQRAIDPQPLHIQKDHFH